MCHGLVSVYFFVTTIRGFQKPTNRAVALSSVITVELLPINDHCSRVSELATVEYQHSAAVRQH